MTPKLWSALPGALRIVGDIDSVELKVTVAEGRHRAAAAALGIDPLNAHIRQVYFFDTLDLLLSGRGVIVRARRIQSGDGDSVVALLLTVAFTGAFAEADLFQRTVYVITLVLTAPVAYHRRLFQRGPQGGGGAGDAPAAAGRSGTRRAGATAIERLDPLSSDRLARADDEIDALLHQLLRTLFAENWSHGGTGGPHRAHRPLLRALCRPCGGDRGTGRLSGHRADASQFRPIASPPIRGTDSNMLTLAR